jgi:hypothetical protein
MRGLAALLVSAALATSLLGCSSGDDSGLTVEPNGGSGGASAAHAGAAGSTAHAGASGSGTAGAEQNAEAGAAGTDNGAAGADTSSGGNDTGGAANGGNPNQAGSGGTAGGAGSSGSAGTVSVAGSAGTAATAGGGGADQGGSGGAAVVTVPSDPTTLVLQVIDGATVGLTWTDTANNETGYNVYWSTTTDKPAQPNTQLAANIGTFSATGLTTGQLYYFWVEAYDSAGASQALTGSATPAPVPAAPTGLVVTGGATQLTLTWTNNASGDTGYRIFYAATSSQPAAAQHQLSADSTTYTFDAGELTAYTPYYFWVVAYNATGNSAPATGTGAVGSAPSAPTGVTVDAATNLYSIDVNWTDSGANSSGFNVYWSTDDTQPATPNATVAGDVTDYKLKQIFGAQTYRFWIEATNAIGKSTATKATASAATADLSWVELWLDSGSSVHLALKDDLGGLTGGDAATALYAYHSASATAMGTGTLIAPYVIWGTAANNIDTTAIHYFWTEARTASGSLFSVRTMSPAGAVANLTATPADLSAALAWDATSGAAAYQSYWGTGSFSTALLSGTGTLNSSTVSGLNAGTQYSFWVRAVAPAINVAAGQYGFPGPVATVQSTTTGSGLGANLALGKTALASSGGSPSNVTDGNYGTRWQAATINAGEWIYVDLGSDIDVTDVKLVWEAAYANNFDIQVCPASCAGGSADSTTWLWQAAYSATRTLPGPFPYYELLHLQTPITGEYVRMHANVAALPPYGASLYEFEVYSAP